LEPEAALALNQRQATAQLSGRGHERVLRLARTIADLEGREEIVADDVEEACTHRQRQGDDV
jgi:magnesium chelatase family protein